MSTLKSLLTSCIIMAAMVTLAACAKHWTGRPHWTKKVEMARFMVRNADWGILSLTSEKFKITVGNIQSFADGPVGGSTGVPYFYIAGLEDAYRDIRHNNTASFYLTEQMSDYCESKHLDPEEPLCSRLMLAGKIVKVANQKEIQFARNALFQRHPAMKGWPIGHSWYVYKFDLTLVYLLDFYGGGTIIPLKDYFNAQ